MNIKHIDSLRNKKKISMGFFCKLLISEAENLYITFLEPEKPKKQGFKLMKQTEVDEIGHAK